MLPTVGPLGYQYGSTIYPIAPPVNSGLPIPARTSVEISSQTWYWRTTASSTTLTSSASVSTSACSTTSTTSWIRGATPIPPGPASLGFTSSDTCTAAAPSSPPTSSASATTSAGVSKTSVSWASVSSQATSSSTYNFKPVATSVPPAFELASSRVKTKRGIPIGTWVYPSFPVANARSDSMPAKPRINLQKPQAPVGLFPQASQTQLEDFYDVIQDIVFDAMDIYAQRIEGKIKEMEDQILAKITSSAAPSSSTEPTEHYLEPSPERLNEISNNLVENVMQSIRDSAHEIVKNYPKEYANSEPPKPSTIKVDIRSTDESKSHCEKSNSNTEIAKLNYRLDRLQTELAISWDRIRELEFRMGKMVVSCRDKAHSTTTEIIKDFETRLTDLEKKVDSWSDEYSYYEDDDREQHNYPL